MHKLCQKKVNHKAVFVNARSEKPCWEQTGGGWIQISHVQFFAFHIVPVNQNENGAKP